MIGNQDSLYYFRLFYFIFLLWENRKFEEIWNLEKFRIFEKFLKHFFDKLEFWNLIFFLENGNFCK